MEELPPEWQAYARLQDRLSNRDVVDQRSWGLEAALDAALASFHAGQHEPRNLIASVAAGKARERHRGKLLAQHAFEVDVSVNPVLQLEQRDLVRRAQRKLRRADLQLVVNIAAGYSPDELAIPFRASAATLRKRLQRIRDAMSALAA